MVYPEQVTPSSIVIYPTIAVLLMAPRRVQIDGFVWSKKWSAARGEKGVFGAGRDSVGFVAPLVGLFPPMGQGEVWVLGHLGRIGEKKMASSGLAMRPAEVEVEAEVEDEVGEAYWEKERPKRVLFASFARARD